MATFNFVGTTNVADSFTSVLAQSQRQSASINTIDNGVAFTFSVNIFQIGSTAQQHFVYVSQSTGLSQLYAYFSNTFAGSFGFSANISFATTPSMTAFTASPFVSYSTGSLSGVSLNQKVSGNQLSIYFTSSGPLTSGGIAISSLFANFTCFCKDTMIATPDGPVAIQDLTAGDIVLSADGKTRQVQAIGKQQVNARLTHPRTVNPVNIRAGALGNGLPVRDLSLSPDHAVLLNGYLVNAGALVNGTTITQSLKMLPEDFTYYHVDTGAHDVLLAEGVECESFIDYAGRDGFENGDDVTNQIPEMPLPRISAARMLPDTIRTRICPPQSYAA